MSLICLDTRPKRNQVNVSYRWTQKVNFLFLYMFRTHTIVIEQTLLSASNNSYSATLLKCLRNNLDWFACFNNTEREWRTFISSIASGDEFIILKNVLLTSSLQKYDGLDLSDTRSSFPYSFCLLNRGNKNFRFR